MFKALAKVRGTGRASLLAVVLCLALTAPAMGQSVSVGADVVSRYVWRGYDFGESAAVQPGLSFSTGGFEVGAWGSYSVSADGASANENDLYASYTVETGSGLSVGLTLTDYYFPAPESDVTFGDGDAHYPELMLSLGGPESFPIDLAAGVFTGGEGTYIEGGIPFTAGDVGVRLHLGVVAGESDFYGTDGAAVVNMGVTGEAAITVTESFEVPVFAQYILNPDRERAHLVFGFSLAP